jgi:hypothetical protein
MSHDGLPARALIGARAADTDRSHRRHLATITALGAGAVLMLVACGTATSSGGVVVPTGSAVVLPSELASIEASASALAGANKAFLTFQAMNSSNVSGGGTIIDLGDGSSAVTLGIIAPGFEDPLPARLVSGACADAASAPSPSFEVPSEAPSGGASAAPSAAASAAPSAAASVAPSAAASTAPSAAESTAPSAQTLPVELKDVTGGLSNTVVQVAESSLVSSPSSVLLYKSAKEPTLVACADVATQLVLPSGLPSAIASALPSALSSLAAESPSPS